MEHTIANRGTYPVSYSELTNHSQTQLKTAFTYRFFCLDSKQLVSCGARLAANIPKDLLVFWVMCYE